MFYSRVFTHCRACNEKRTRTKNALLRRRTVCPLFGSPYHSVAAAFSDVAPLKPRVTATEHFGAAAVTRGVCISGSALYTYLIMTESVHDPLPLPDFSLSESPEGNPMLRDNPVSALADKVRYVSPLFGDRIESEIRHAERRFSMLVQASEYYEQRQFLQAASELKQIKRDLEIAGDPTYITDINAVIDDCVRSASAKIAGTAVGRYAQYPNET